MKKTLSLRSAYQCRSPKVPRVMMWICILLFMGLSHVNAAVKGQAALVSISAKGLSVEEVLKSIEEQSGYTFIYLNDDVSTLKKVDLDVEKVKVSEVLDKCLRDTELDFEIDKDLVIIKRTSKPEELIQQEEVRIKGIVKDQSGLGIPGASVLVKGTTVGTATDMDGAFDFLVEKTPNMVLEVSFIGMKTKEITYSGQDFISVVLADDSELIDEIIVTGYQTIDRKLFTGSATIVNSEEAVVQGESDVSRMLQGKAAGVQVQNVSGTFGASPKIRVRGSSSILGSSKPLWVLDGVVLEDVVDISSDDLASGNAVTLIGSAVAGVNADDIESFQVLKDASATALYGARAMNGVIIITTKKGQRGQVRVNYSLETTMKEKPNYRNYDIINSQEQMGVYLDMREKGLLNHASISRAPSSGVFGKMYELINTYNPENQSFGLANTPSAQNAFLRKAELRNTDWFDELFRNSIQQNHSLSMSGGSEKATFYASLGFLNDPGWTISDKVSRYTSNLNATVKITPFIDLNLSSNNSIRLQRIPGTIDRQKNVVSGEYSRNFDINPFSYALNASRTMAAKDENGDPAYYMMNYAPFSILNESASNFIDLDYLDSKIQAELSARPYEGVEIRALGALRYVKTTREHKIDENSNMANAYRAASDATIRKNNPFLYQDPENPAALPEVVLPIGGFYNRDDNTMLNYYFRTTASFNRLFDEKHNVNALFGQEIRYADRITSFNRGYGYQWGKGGVPFVDYRILKQIIEGGFQYYGMKQYYDRFAAFFGTAGYSFDERYTFNVTGRYDGSNRLGKSKSARWLPTWNMSGAWHIDRENFMADNRTISRLNLRATYGLTASMGPASNARAIYLNEVTVRPYDYDKENQIVIDRLENSDLTWEKQYETNIGVDLALWDGRLSVSTDFYQRNGFDLIGGVTTSAIGGEGFKLANYADMISKGFEFTLNTSNIERKDFSWNTNITFAYNKNKITKLEAGSTVLELVSETGGPRQGYPVKGLFSIPFEGLNDEGIPVLTDADGGSSSESIDFQGLDVDYLKYEGPIDPTIVGGVNNTLKYKRLSMGVYVTYQAGNKIRLNPSFKSSYTDIYAMSRDILNRWRVPGDEYLTDIPTIPSARQLKKYPYLGEVYNAYNYSTARVADGGFIRLKDIVLTYDIPFQNMQLKFTASNVCLLYSDKKLNGQDPEFFRSGGVAMPVPRQYTLTFKIGF